MGLAEVISQAATPQTAVVEARPNLYLLAGGRALAGVRRLIARKDFGSERTLAEALEPIEGQYDFVLFDTAPGWDPLTVNVLFYATEVLAPVSLEVLTIQGLRCQGRSKTRPKGGGTLDHPAAGRSV